MPARLFKAPAMVAVTGLLVATLAFSTSAAAEPGNGNGNGNAQSETKSAKKPVPVPDNWEARVLKLTNNKRAKHGLKPVKASQCASKYAERWAHKMASENFFEHQNLGGLLKCPDVWVAGENIAMGFSRPRDVVKAWMKSPGHRAIILDKRFTQLYAAGVTAPDGSVYWVQNFVGD